MKKLHIIIFIVISAINIKAQQRYSANQTVYDLGLISTHDPFIANRNAAQLMQIKDYQVGLNIDLSEPIGSIISVCGPIQHNLAIGIA